jgi:hypothetical protein
MKSSKQEERKEVTFMKTEKLENQVPANPLGRAYAEQEQAGAIINSENVLDEVVKTLQCMGVAGQEREIKILYLTLTSRVLDRPVNVVVKGPSSGGKSFLVEKVLELFPPSAYHALTAMSQKALAYSEESLSHRYLVIFEAAGLGSDFSQYLIRSLLSEGRIRYETLENIKGKWTPRTIEQEGPTGLIITTTKASLHPENETRMLSLEINDSKEQTSKILRAGARGENADNVDLSPFLQIQERVEKEKLQAVVPFAEKIAAGCDNTVLRLRRDFPMVLSLIKAHAILHASQRSRDDQGTVIAEIDDYRAVYDLVADKVAQAAARSVSETTRETVKAVKELSAKNRLLGGLSYTEISKHLGMDKSAGRRRVIVAMQKGYLVNEEPRKGMPARIVIGDPLPDEKSVLPPPDSL